MNQSQNKFKKGDEVHVLNKSVTGVVEGYINVKDVDFVLLTDGGFWLESELALIA